MFSSNSVCEQRLARVNNGLVCIIGAGTAGLCALRHALAHDMMAIAYERGTEIGGTWIYTQEVPANSHDEVHSSMYEGLRTNLPKEVMGYPDFPYPTDIEESYINSDQVLEFLRSYMAHYKLEPHIKFQHEIIRVRPHAVEGWEVFVRNHVDDSCSIKYFNYVLVCNGHYTTPTMPHINGMDIYRGKQIHSHVYREPSPFIDTTVLIIGAGPSGIDIANHIRQTAKTVYMSHHIAADFKTDFMPNVVQKPDVEHFTETGAVFKDGSHADFGTVIYCTGYQNTFPCLSTDAGLHVEDNFVQPLWKHCININNPTMAIIGLPFHVLPTQLIDMQVRFVLKFYSGQLDLPAREDMLADLEQEISVHGGRRKAHQMGEKQYDYYKDLSRISGIVCIKPVIMKMMRDCSKKYIADLENFRYNCYKIIDDENFIKYTIN